MFPNRFLNFMIVIIFGFELGIMSFNASAAKSALISLLINEE